MENPPASEKVMTVSEVASVLKINERTVRKYIENLFPNKMKNGIKTLLNEREVTLLKLDLEKNSYLEQVGQLPKTELEETLLIQQAQDILSQRISRLQDQVNTQQLQIEADKPKVEFHSQVEASINSISVAEFANMLTKNGFKIGQNKLFKWFYENRYLINSSRPYQNALDARWFEIKKVTYKDREENERTAHKILVTGKGQTYFTKKIVNKS